ncbi:hypothetical protein HY251_05765, partial [bacterium]|nr:hypothetical protein [bacterium]
MSGTSRTPALGGSLLVLLALSSARAGDVPERHREHKDELGDPLPKQALARLGTTRFRALGKLVFSPDGRAVACTWTSGEGTVLFEVPTGRELARLAGCHSNTAAICSDGRTLVAVRGGSIALWDLARGELASRDLGPENTIATAISPDGSLAAVRDHALPGKCRLRVLRTRTGEEVARLESARDGFERVVISGDGRALAAERADGSIAVFDLARSRLATSLVEPGETLTPGEFSPDGRTLAVLGKGGISLWDRATGARLGKLACAHESVLAFSLDGKLLASRDGERESAGVVVWDVSSKAPLRRIALPDVLSLAFSPTENVLAASRSDAAIVLLDPLTGIDLAPLPGHRAAVVALAFLGDGKRLVSSEQRLSIVWDVDTRSEVSRIAHATAHTPPVVSPDGKLLATTETKARKSTIVFLDIETGGLVRRLEKVRATAVSLAFSPGRKTLAVSADDGTARLVDLASGRETRIIESWGGRTRPRSPSLRRERGWRWERRTASCASTTPSRGGCSRRSTGSTGATSPPSRSRPTGRGSRSAGSSAEPASSTSRTRPSLRSRSRKTRGRA